MNFWKFLLWLLFLFMVMSIIYASLKYLVAGAVIFLLAAVALYFVYRIAKVRL